MSDSSLVLPGQSPAGAVDDSFMNSLPEVVWLRNPKTGVINKYLKSRQWDSIAHALKGETGEGGRTPFTLSTEAAAREQAVELAKLQGRPLPPWAPELQVEEAEPAEPAKPAQKTRG